jgi:uncharacterized protein YjiK
LKTFLKIFLETKVKFFTAFILISISLMFSINAICQSLSFYDFSPENADRLKLSSELLEISGLAVTPSGKLFSHADEKGSIYQIDPASGKVIKKFRLGENAVYSDFEGIAVADKKIFLVDSKGELYLFYEQGNNAYSRYTKIKTSLSVKNDIEGLCFDPSTYTLLIACKGKAGEGYDNYKAVYSFDISSRKLNDKPRFLISLEELEKRFGIRKFSPSSIERQPSSGSFFILSSDDKCIIELSPKGELLGAVKLNNKFHKQPEGITFIGNSEILICDEGGKGEAALTRYHLK